eukprot:m.112735 g.112735  ORF g.112735 m.112735 type:complete len:109 (+) comp17037_c0_seq2:316-642(+)
MFHDVRVCVSVCVRPCPAAFQGSILDRIDYNIEMASHHVEKGRVELEQANTYQKRASKKLCIMLLIVICVGLFFAIVFKKKVVDHSPSAAPTAAPSPAPPPTTALLYP